MKTISNDFRDALRGIKQLNGRVTYISGDTPYILTTEDNYNLNTENSFDIGTEKGLADLESEKLYGINPVFDVPLLKTICKSLELDSAIDIPINTEINAEIGVLVDDEYEYINFGKYYVKSSIYQLDTNTYKITCYDAMADAMVKYDDDSAFTNLTIGGVVNEICSRLGWTTTIINNTVITDVWRTQQMTYRDILDELCSILGNMYLTDDKQLMTIKPLEQNEVSETITDEDMKNTSVDIGKQVEITKAMVTQSDVTLYEKGTGENAFKFDNNHLLMAQTDLREIACDNIIGLTYYPFDIETWGLLIYDPLDKVSIEHDGETYTTYILKDDIKYQRGLEERIETTDELSSINGMTFYSQQEQATRDAQIRIDKANAEIELVTNEVFPDGTTQESAIEQNANEIGLRLKTDDFTNASITAKLNDGTSEVQIDADKIDLTGKQINLTSDNVTIDSTYLDIDSDGNLILTSTADDGTKGKFEQSGLVINGGTCKTQLLGGGLYYNYWTNNTTGVETITVNIVGYNYPTIELKCADNTDSLVLLYALPMETALSLMGTNTRTDITNTHSNFGGNVYPTTDNVGTLGTPTNKWNAIYCTSGTINTSDRNEKKNIKDIPILTAKNIVMGLKPVTYKFKKNESDRTHYGLIAQDVEELINQLNIDSKDFAPLVKTENEDGSTSYGLRYEEFIAPIIKTIQSQQYEIDKLKREIEQLKKQG
jgi:hypothetical protein